MLEGEVLPPEAPALNPKLEVFGETFEQKGGVTKVVEALPEGPMKQSVKALENKSVKLIEREGIYTDESLLEIRRTEIAQARYQKERRINPERDEIQTAIAKIGGISRVDAQAAGIDPANFNIRAGGFYGGILKQIHVIRSSLWAAIVLPKGTH